MSVATPAHADATVELAGVTYELADPDDPGLGAVAISYTRDDNPDHPQLSIPEQVSIDAESVPVISVGFQAFLTAGLESVQLPATLTSIDTSAFAQNKLTTVDLPDTLTSIGSYAFTRNDITSLDLPELTHLGNSAFSANEISTLTLPSSLTTIEARAFWLNDLTEVVIPASIAQVGDEAFARNDLRQVTIPAGVTELGTAVFMDNPGLEVVRFLGPEPQASANPIIGDQDVTNPLIEYLWREGEGQAANGGFTWPTWYEFDTTPVINVQFTDPEVGTPMPAPIRVPLNHSTDGVPWGTVPEAAEPAAPHHPEREFLGWLAADSGTTEGQRPWVSGDPLHGDTTITARWAPVPVEIVTIDVHASAVTVDEGGSVVLTAEGFDAQGSSLGDVTAETTFTSDVATDMVDGDHVTFPTASQHTITGTHQGGATDAVVIDVVPTAVEPVEPTEPAETGAPGSTPSTTDTGAAVPTDSGATLATTGFGPQPLTAAAALMTLGALLLAVTRRKNATSVRTGTQ
ncbi:leucine-rich repeat protein [Ruania halotolerans]|uniref:leucine-rich repeat protein n=1 Tax=Ruania halotolerans TaxID=2897773 RepID=UPI001E6163B1|nr:leucine-rich repeat protein [Ruania halotolerans]UFU07342.1 leucine-rich repeat protein [Ruania halotolerans]